MNATARVSSRLLAPLAILVGTFAGGTIPDPAATAGGVPSSPGLYSDTITVDTLERTFSVFVPRMVRPTAGVVLALHGGSGGSGARLRGFIGRELERLAEARGFLVAYPDGIDGSWNGCRAGATNPAKVRQIDDVAFVRTLIAHLQQTQGIDPARVFALGYSNGAHLAFRLALEVPDAVRAIAAFGANLPAADALDCRTSGVGVAALLVNGTADRINPFGGGAVRLPDGTMLGRVRSAAASAEYFARLAGHSGPGARDTILAPHPVDGLAVERLRFVKAGAPEIVLYAIHGGGHTIPSAGARFPDFLGATERRFVAVEAAIDFFQRQIADESPARSP